MQCLDLSYVFVYYSNFVWYEAVMTQLRSAEVTREFVLCGVTCNVLTPPPVALAIVPVANSVPPLQLA